jgi:fatty-acyl-CoA synthase
VLGVPDPVWGEIGIAVCVNRPGQHATEGEIADFLGPKIARYKMPKRLVKDEMEKRGELDFLKGKAS